MISDRQLGSVAASVLFVLAATVSVVAQDESRVAAPLHGGGPATFDSNIPSYRFAEHLVRAPGVLAQFNAGVVVLFGERYPAVIFAAWDDFEAYATCSGIEIVRCDLAYFDYAAGEIRQYDLPLEAALNRNYLTKLSNSLSLENLDTPPKGAGQSAVRDRSTPSSGTSQYLSLAQGVVRVADPGVIAVYVHEQFEYPNSFYASGPGFEAGGLCAKRITVGCTVNFFDYGQREIRRYHIGLEDALKLSTYVDLVEPTSANP